MKAAAPGSIATLGTLNIVFGALFSFCCAASLVRLAAGFALFLGPRFEQEQLQQFLEREIALHQGIEWAGAFGGAIVFGLMFVAGVGLVSRRNWGRIAAIIDALLLTAYGIGMIVYNLALEAPTVARFLNDQRLAGDVFPPGLAWTIYAAISVILTLAVVYALLSLILLLRRPVRDYFTGAAFDIERFDDDDWDDNPRDRR